MSQAWDLSLAVLVVAGSGSGNNLSAGVGAASASQDWALALYTGTTVASGSGNNLSAGVGAASASQDWALALYTGTTVAASGSGNNLSAGVGVASDNNATWYDVVATVEAPTRHITMNLQLPEGVEVGAYLTSEWRGHLVPMRRSGSYPGPVVATADVDAYGQVTFTTLAPGEYVAYAADYPLRRRFFVIHD